MIEQFGVPWGFVIPFATGVLLAVLSAIADITPAEKTEAYAGIAFWVAASAIGLVVWVIRALQSVGVFP